MASKVLAKTQDEVNTYSSQIIPKELQKKEHYPTHSMKPVSSDAKERQHITKKKTHRKLQANITNNNMEQKSLTKYYKPNSTIH